MQKLDVYEAKSETIIVMCLRLARTKSGTEQRAGPG